MQNGTLTPGFWTFLRIQKSEAHLMFSVFVLIASESEISCFRCWNPWEFGSACVGWLWVISRRLPVVCPAWPWPHPFATCHSAFSFDYLDFSPIYYLHSYPETSTGIETRADCYAKGGIAIAWMQRCGRRLPLTPKEWPPAILLDLVAIPYFYCGPQESSRTTRENRSCRWWCRASAWSTIDCLNRAGSCCSTSSTTDPRS